ncbi:MAG: hypothetical protein JXA45_05400, partial [Methanomassiliicoccales archaeon]|nr:hypothetical protein [Methanomassiliicoccales archaeon]
ASGTQIKNAASIVFDYNPAIVTNEVINTIDSTCPTSHIQAMDQDQPRDFTVSWTGNDAGSGVASWDVLVSVDGGAFILWLDRTANTFAEYHGEIGHNYSFYSIAYDNVGNIETASQSNKVSVTVSITDGFPADEVVILIAVLLVVAVGAWFLLARRRKK